MNDDTTQFIVFVSCIIRRWGTAKMKMYVCVCVCNLFEGSARYWLSFATSWLLLCFCHHSNFELAMIVCSFFFWCDIYRYAAPRLYIRIYNICTSLLPLNHKSEFSPTSERGWHKDHGNRRSRSMKLKTLFTFGWVTIVAQTTRMTCLKHALTILLHYNNDL